MGESILNHGTTASTPCPMRSVDTSRLDEPFVGSTGLNCGWLIDQALKPWQERVYTLNDIIDHIIALSASGPSTGQILSSWLRSSLSLRQKVSILQFVSWKSMTSFIWMLSVPGQCKGDEHSFSVKAHQMDSGKYLSATILPDSKWHGAAHRPINCDFRQ